MVRTSTFFLIMLFAAGISNTAYSQGASCETAEPFCSDNSGELIFANVTGVPSSGAIGCLTTTPNPVWYFLRVSQTGSLSFDIIQTDNNGGGIDVDFIAWGPFSAPSGNCNNLAQACDDDGDGNPTNACPTNTVAGNYYIDDLDNTNIVDCSYDSASIESFTILNAIAGEFYLLLITNYHPPGEGPGTPGFIKLEQTNFGDSGSGETDCSIVVGELGPDIDECEGTTVTLDGTTADAALYEWSVDTTPDDGTDNFTQLAGENNATLDITNNQTGIYRVEVTDTNGDSGSDEILVTFFSVPIANTVTDIRACEGTTGSGISSSFDTSTVESQVLGGQTGIAVTYFDGNGTLIGNSLPNPYTNAIANSETITVRVANSSLTSCFSETTFALIAENLPVANTATNLEECDSDRDGFASTFDTSNISATVLGSQTGMTLEYFDGTGASLGNTLPNPMTNSNAVNGVETIIVRVTDTSTTNSCFAETTFDLISNPYDVASTPPAFIQCDDLSNDGTATFILDTQDDSILGTESESDFIITYHSTAADALNDASALPNSYT